MSDERLLFSADAEAAVVGSLFLSNKALDLIDDKVSPDDFYIGAYREIYKAFRTLLLDGKSADVVTVGQTLELAGTLEDAGGMKRLEQILQNVPTAANVVHYARIVRERALERRLLEASVQISTIARARGAVNERLDEAQRLVLSITEQAATNEPVMVKEAISGFLTDLEERVKREGEILGMTTTINDLDARLAGLHNGQLVVIAARPGMGKSSLALQIAARNAANGKVGLIFSLEMGRNELAEKMLANIGKIDMQQMRQGKVDWDLISAATGRIHDAPLIIDDAPNVTIDALRVRARRVKRKHGRLDVVVVDYLQLMSAEGDNRVQEVSNITRGLKILAKELDCPVIALSQLNRSCEARTNKRPMLSDLRESGSVEQDADVVIFIYRDEVYNPQTNDRGVAELIIAKQRMGPIGTVGSTFIGEHGFFGDTEWRARSQESTTKTERKAIGYHGVEEKEEVTDAPF